MGMPTQRYIHFLIPPSVNDMPRALYGVNIGEEFVHSILELSNFL
jgi:hypothetical protein